ncbi:trimeric intracellular cation channel family protein [Haloarchaeobius amylolyticus]|uniref:trimeric intracellular cation channel family protein n=1 Tax=Haloarchaeobius amylolyticus TaxID=1198296 RepID=UPI00226E3B32|nr:trimeric intracellular cation channel family protein [Haloarchaeobius amylolyticus]
MLTPFAAMNALGTVAFGAAGASKGVEKDLDYLGVSVLGVVTALGGGITRDLLVGKVPGALLSELDMTLALAGVGVAIVLAHLEAGDIADSPLLTIPDAIGLAAFAGTGAIVGYQAGLSPFGVVITATLTGTGGGAIRDLLAQEVPSILHEDFYATCALAGGAVFWVVREAGGPQVWATALSVGLALGLRLAAMRYDWSLPNP